MKNKLRAIGSLCLVLAMQVGFAQLPAQVQLGMNGVPVVDQGWEWGTCMTSAITAGLNAYHGWRGDDRISATCFIELTRSLPTVTAETWWDDGDPMQALLLMSRYGVWTLRDQAHIQINAKPACGGLLRYPFTVGSSDFATAPAYKDVKQLAQLEDDQRHRDGGMGAGMSIAQYRQYAHRSIDADDWHVLDSGMQHNPAQQIQLIKSAIASGDRVIVGLFYDPFLIDHGRGLGALGQYKQPNDSWVLTKAISDDIDAERNLSGHAVLLTGYDDKACIDKQCGLFTVRNSVGVDMGDHGDYYLSYDYVSADLLYGAIIAIGPMVH